MSDDYLLNIGEVGKLVSLSRSAIYDLQKQGVFPKPVKIGEKAIRWRASTIQSWIVGLDEDTEDEN